MKAKLLLLLSLFVLQSNAQCWDKISSGAYHTIAIAHDGTLWAWGYNNTGQLGNGNTTNQINPVKIGNDTNWSLVKTGYYHSFAIKTDGTLWVWGFNTSGQLGNGNNTNQLSPVQIGSSQWIDVVGGEDFSIGIKSDGTLWSWGSNTNGQLGDGALGARNYPAQIGTATDWSQVAAGRYHALSLKTTKKLWAWGFNSSGQLGDSSYINRTTPVAVNPTLSFDYITGGVSSSAGITDVGQLYGWGIGYLFNVQFPNQISTLSGWSSVKLGNSHIVAIRTLSNVNYLYTWGDNSYGQLGNSAYSYSTAPLNITTISNWSSKISTNFYSTQILSSNGQLYGAGQNHVGQLANNGNANVTNLSLVTCPSVLSSDTFDSQNIISLYPNPVSNQLNISTSSEIQKLAIYDVTGKQVKYQEGNTNTIDVQELKSGFYLIEITIDGNKEIKKFLKQ